MMCSSVPLLLPINHICILLSKASKIWLAREGIGMNEINVHVMGNNASSTFLKHLSFFLNVEPWPGLPRLALSHQVLEVHQGQWIRPPRKSRFSTEKQEMANHHCWKQNWRLEGSWIHLMFLWFLHLSGKSTYSILRVICRQAFVTPFLMDHLENKWHFKCPLTLA